GSPRLVPRRNTLPVRGKAYGEVSRGTPAKSCPPGLQAERPLARVSLSRDSIVGKRRPAPLAAIPGEATYGCDSGQIAGFSSPGCRPWEQGPDESATRMRRR